MRKTTALLAIPILLAACETAGPVTDPCGPWRAIRVSRSDVFTPETARQVKAHNETGARLCQWEPRQ